jgi:HAMP domain-containing protein
MLRNRSLWTRFLLLTFALLATIAVAVVLLLGRLHIGAAYDKAVLVADVAEALSAWGARPSGVWARSERADAGDVGEYLEEVPLFKPDASAQITKGLTAGASRDDLRQAGLIVGGFHRKHPTEVDREVAAVMRQQSGAVAWRFVPDTRSEKVKPTAFESEAIARFRGTSESTIYRVEGKDLLYARRVNAGASCVACHEAWVTQVARSTGAPPQFRQGELAAIYSVQIPVVAGGRFGELTAAEWASIALVGLFLIALLGFVWQRVIGPMQKLAKAAEAASQSDIQSVPASALLITEREESSRDELDRLSVATKRLLRSIELLRAR